MAKRATRGPDRRRLIRAFGIGVLTVIAVGSLALAWAVLPRSMGEIRVEAVRRQSSPTASDDDKPASEATPVRIVVTFIASEDVERVRERVGLGYVAARLADCRNGAAHTLEVVAQRAEYLREDKRVQRMGATRAGGARYRAAFDDVLTETTDHEARSTRALGTPGGLCFSLYGASMWFGWGRSNVVRIEVQP